MLLLKLYLISHSSVDGDHGNSLVYLRQVILFLFHIMLKIVLSCIYVVVYLDDYITIQHCYIGQVQLAWVSLSIKEEAPNKNDGNKKM